MTTEAILDEQTPSQRDIINRVTRVLSDDDDVDDAAAALLNIAGAMVGNGLRSRGADHEEAKKLIKDLALLFSKLAGSAYND